MSAQSVIFASGVVVLFAAMAAGAIRVLAYTPPHSYDDEFVANGSLLIHTVTVPGSLDIFTTGIIIAIAAAVSLIIIGSES